jgi:hypothetical protein
MHASTHRHERSSVSAVATIERIRPPTSASRAAFCWVVLGVPGPVGIHSGTARTSWLLRSDVEISTVIGVFQSLSLADLRATVYHGGVGGAWTVREMYTLTASYRADYQRGDLRGQLPPDGHVTRGVVAVGVTIAPRLKRTFTPLQRDPALPMTGVQWP